MGIYPQPAEISERKFPDENTETWKEVCKPGNGSIRTRRVTAVIESIVWETCFCCSCFDSDGYSSRDPACRNHGFAATRPCELHGTPGAEWGEEGGDLEGTMPESVQKVREAEKARRISAKES